MLNVAIQEWAPGQQLLETARRVELPSARHRRPSINIGPGQRMLRLNWRRTPFWVTVRCLRADHVIDACNRLAAVRGAPVRVFVEGSEFSGRLLDLWAYHHKVRIDFSRPGKPTDNCFIETFNGSLRDECLNVHWFETIDHAARGDEPT